MKHSPRRSFHPFLLTLLLLALAQTSGCGYFGSRQQAVVLDGSRDVHLAMQLDLKRIADQIDRHKDKAQPGEQAKVTAMLQWRQRMGIDAATLLMIETEAAETEFVVTIPDAEQQIWNQVASDRFASMYVEKNNDGSLRPKLDTLVDEGECPKNLASMILQWHDGQIVLAQPQRLRQIKAGTWNAQAAMVHQLMSHVAVDNSLFTLARVFPEKAAIDFDAACEKLKSSKAAEKLPPAAGMMASMATSFFERLQNQLSVTDAMAVSVSLPSDNQRHVHYAQLFHEDDYAKDVHRQLTARDGDGDGLAVGVAELLQDEQVQDRVSRSGRLVEIDAAWEPQADQQVRLLAQSAVQSLFAKALGMEMEPTEGEILTRYRMSPYFVSLKAKKLKRAVEQELRSQLFPGWAHDQGDEPKMQVELDTLTLPNGALSAGSYQVVSVTTTQGSDVLRDEEQPEYARALQLSQPGSCYLQIPFRKGIEKSQLQSARLSFSLNVPTHVDVVEFSASDATGTKQKSGKRSVQIKRIARDVAEVTYRGTDTPQLFAFDKTGRALEGRESMRGGGSAATRFNGTIDKLWVAFPKSIEPMEFTVDLDLHGGEGLKLPDEPSDRTRIRYDAAAVENYVSTRDEELSGLAVELRPATDYERERLSIQLPRASQGIRGAWELYWLAKDRPTSLSGFSFSQNAQLVWGTQDGWGEATAVKGWAKVTVPTEFTTIAFDKQQDGSWLTERVGSQTVKVQFDRNRIAYETGHLNVMALYAFDANGRRLKTEYGNSVGGATSQRAWGQPQRIELVVSGKTIEKILDVDMAREGTDKMAFAAFKRRVPDYHRALAALMQIEKAVQQAAYGYDEIAGLHYLHDRQGKPLRKLPIELAHACPQGAKRFGYEPKPFGGYYFVRLPPGGQQNAPSGQERSFRWDQGEFKVKPTGNLVVVAVPLKSLHPTFAAQWGSAYMKFRRARKIKQIPAQLSQAGWSEVSLVQIPSASGEFASSK